MVYLVTDPSGGIHTAYINQGQTNSGSGAAIQWLPGVTMESSDGRALQFGLQSTAPIAHLTDMDGDGLPLTRTTESIESSPRTTTMRASLSPRALFTIRHYL
jgi:hypothetical protein